MAREAQKGTLYAFVNTALYSTAYIVLYQEGCFNFVLKKLQGNFKFRVDSVYARKYGGTSHAWVNGACGLCFSLGK